MSDDELASLRGEVAELNRKVEGLLHRADAAHGEALACSLLLTQILRKDPTLLRACLNIPIGSEPLSPIHRVAYGRLDQILRPLRG